MLEDKNRIKELAENLKKMLSVPNTSSDAFSETPVDAKKGEKEYDENFTRTVAIFSIDYGIRLTSHIFENNNSCLYDKEVFFNAMGETLASVANGELTLIPSTQEIFLSREDLIKNLGLTEKDVHNSENLARKLEKLLCADYISELAKLIQLREGF